MTGNMIETPNIDRRVVRTRELLHQALMSLIIEKGYDEVTVAASAIRPMSAVPPFTATSPARTI
ncbi:MAG: hypothetical protein M3Q19_15915 [Pseudomonadota bacterium]|nr:hypothetical protein [Pseudomonadota bacterium]